MSNETKIGLLAIVTIALAFWGYKFIKGKDILSSSNIFYVEYDDVNQMANSTPVLVNGFQVGSVRNLYLKPENMQKVIAELDIDPKIQVPKDAVAAIVSAGIMGGHIIDLQFTTPCNGAQCAQDGDYLNGRTVGMLESMIGKPSDMQEYADVMRENAGSIIDTIMDSDRAIGQTVAEMQMVLQTLKVTTANMNRLIVGSTDQMQGIMTNMESITDNFKGSNQTVQAILANTQDFTQKLSQVELEKTLQEASATLQKLTATLQTTDKTLGEVNQVVAKVNRGEGSLGKLLADDELYKSIEAASAAVDSLASDFQDKPYRYVPLKSRRKVLKHDRRDEALEEQVQN